MTSPAPEPAPQPATAPVTDDVAGATGDPATGSATNPATGPADDPLADCVHCGEPTEYPASTRGVTLCPVCEWQEAQRTACSG